MPKNVSGAKAWTFEAKAIDLEAKAIDLEAKAIDLKAIKIWFQDDSSLH